MRNKETAGATADDQGNQFDNPWFTSQYLLSAATPGPGQSFIVKKMYRLLLFIFLLPAACQSLLGVDDSTRFQPLDVFQIEHASDPQISPDGTQVIYVRNFMDIMTDRQRSNLWVASESEHRPITTGNRNDRSPRWSPDGSRVLYVSNENGKTQLFCRWMDNGLVAKLTNLVNAPSQMTWSPDGKWIAFTMLVPDKPEPFTKLPPQPKGAKWAEPARVIRKLVYRSDGKGYLQNGYHHLFVLPADGGTPRQLTNGEFDHNSAPSWTPDNKFLVFSSNRNEDWEYDPRNSEIYELSLESGEIRALTDRQGPDFHPVISPNGQSIAYLGYKDKLQGYQVTQLHLMLRDGSKKQVVSAELDRDIKAPVWDKDSEGLYFQFDDGGDTRIGHITIDGELRKVAERVGGTTIGRPYSSGSFSVNRSGVVAYTLCSTDRPADVGVVPLDGKTRQWTHLNEDLLGHKQLGQVRELHYASSHDERRIEAWLVTPPGFDPREKYPLILEIHGGPFANYGKRFSAEIQLYAAEGYVVLYVNPRGSTGYGAEFGNLIHHAYPGNDYDDLMSGVDAVLAEGFVDSDQLYVTGGSGGGVLTSWIVGKTARFRAAVAAKPVINWYSFVLTTDAYPFFYKYWFSGLPWDHPEEYIRRSPLSLVGNVTTPTMLLTGEEDYRTPISESEQFYQALKLRKIDTALVRIPETSHGIAARPSNLISKVAHILKWFELHGASKDTSAE